MTGIASSVQKRTRNDIASALAHLRRGGLLVYPTETSYAIGCDATNPAAVRAVFRAKGRDAGKSLPLIVASRAMAARYATLTPLARRLARAYWPGPLTIVAKVKSKKSKVKSPRRNARRALFTFYFLLSPTVVAPNGTVALRVSSHPIARTLSRRLGRPIVATSANRSGDPPACSARSAARACAVSPPLERSEIPSLRWTNGQSRGLPGVAQRAKSGGGIVGHTPSRQSQWKAEEIMVLDAGTLPRRPPSTIVDATGTIVRILRQGSAHLPRESSEHLLRTTRQPKKK